MKKFSTSSQLLHFALALSSVQWDRKIMPCEGQVWKETPDDPPNDLVEGKNWISFPRHWSEVYFSDWNARHKRSWKFPDNELIASGWVAIILKGFILLRGWKALWGVCMQTKTRGIWSHLEKGGAAVLAESLENIYIPAPFISYSCCTEEDINRTNYKNTGSTQIPKSYCINVHRSLAKS